MIGGAICTASSGSAIAKRPERNATEIKALRICFVTTEITPLAKTGGLADVSAALCQYLHKQGHDLRIIMPRYGTLLECETEPDPEIPDIEVHFADRSVRIGIQRGRLPDSSLVPYFLDCPEFYHRPGLYSDAPDEHRRFLLLCDAALKLCQHLTWAPDIFHCNDWQSALIPLLLKSRFAWDRLFERSRSLLAIHNIGYQGIFDAAILPDTGLLDTPWHFHQEDLRHGQINFLKTGLLYADRLVTVSPNYAEEIRTPEYGMGLDGLLRQRSDVLSGILNGVDTDVWNPATDPHLWRHYDCDSLDDKAINRRQLLQQCHLQDGPQPLVGIVSRLAIQKGFDLIEATLPAFIERQQLRLVVLGSGDPHYSAFFQWLQRRHPDWVHFHQGFSNALAHRIEAGADLFLMPSRYEPCGLNQMYSLRYGTIPIVRKTGGLADTVQPYDQTTGQGNGVVFEHYDANGLAWALRTALKLYGEPQYWRQMQRNAMQCDFSWQHQGAEYEALYQAMRARS